MKYDLILLCAGEGQRAALGYNKVLYRIKGQKELFLYSFEFFSQDPDCERIIIVYGEKDYNYIKAVLEGKTSKEVLFIEGGKTRGESVKAGISIAKSEYVIVHDSARPLLYKEDIIAIKKAAVFSDGVTLASKVYNTTCLINDGYVESYFSRHTLASIITPQCFKRDKLVSVYEKALKDGKEFTDDSSIFKSYGENVKLVFSDNISIKATTIYDIKTLEALLDANW